MLDHAELAARAFFDGLEAGFQIAHVGVQRIVTRLELRVRIALLRKLPIVRAHLKPAALSEPHRILQRDDQRDEDVGEDAHGDVSEG